MSDYNLIQNYKKIQSEYPRELYQIGMDSLLYMQQDEGCSPHEVLSPVDLRLLKVCVKLQRQINELIESTSPHVPWNS